MEASAVKKQWMKHVSSLNHEGIKMKRFPCQLEYTVQQCFVSSSVVLSIISVGRGLLYF